ncbi:MAG: AMP-binding protein [Alphaproteobacteria bacterium]|nr:AMP-binding protein [Alphaproteobacteria bacterium]
MPELETLQELRQGLAAHGETAAIVAFAGENEATWSFARLEDTSACLGAGLARCGIARGDSVGLIAPNSALWIVTFWGIIAAGATAVPFDPQTDDRDLAHMIQSAGCRLVFTTAANAARVSSFAPSCRVVLLDRDADATDGTAWRSLVTTPAEAGPATKPNDVTVMVFTSGTTGTPKAVSLTHANLLTNVRALCAIRIVGPRDRALLPLPLYHVYPLTIGMLTPLALGCGIVLPAGVSGPELIAAMRRGRVTALVGVPRLYTALFDHLRRGIATRPRPVAALLRVLLASSRWAWRRGMSGPGRFLLRPLRRQMASRLRLLVSGGAAISAEVEETLDAMGWEMLTGYGLVETSSMLTFNPPGASRPGSAGRPVPGMAVRIANPGADGVGEIEARGPSLFAGYYRDPERTRAVFTADGWFRTGDLGALDRQGYLHIAARKTETIVLADGKKLFPEAFEDTYATAPLIREVALLGIKGVLAALVVPDLDAAREAGALRLEDALREGLMAKAAALPSYARLSGFAITREALPRTQLGKIRRHLLPALYEAALRHEETPGPAELSAEDRALLEKPAAAAVWRWLAQRFSGRTLSLDTSLQLDLAVDSLGWVELTLALEHDLAIVLREREIARIVTVRDLLREAVDARESGKGTALAVADDRRFAPLGPWLGVLRDAGEPLIRFAMRRAFRLRVEGIDQLPPDDPILICANHVSYLDPFALGSALPRDRLRRTFWGGWTGVVFNTRLRRLFSRIARVIPVDPDRAAVSSLAAGRLALQRGWNLVWFPEGSRSPDGRLQRFLPGIGALVEGRVVPIVPVYIDGGFAAWPVGRRFPRRRPITVRFGKPIFPPSTVLEMSARRREEYVAAMVQAAVAALAD